MTIVLPKKYPIRRALEERRILCIDRERAEREDIRPLRIGILNIMPQAETYEYSLMFPLGRSVIQIEPVWLRLRTHGYGSTNRIHLYNFYRTFESVVETRPLDGLILTGAPVEEIPFEEVTYWDEIQYIMTYARTHIVSTLGICWGGLALARFLGIEKVPYPRKLFGVFETRNIDRKHRITGELDDVFWCPQSRHSGIPDTVLEGARDKGMVHLLGYSPRAGYTLFESMDHRFLMHLGHPEYEVTRLVEEYRRDITKGRVDVEKPENFDIDNPVNRWRTLSLEFFSQWIKYIHEETAFANGNHQQSPQ